MIKIKVTKEFKEDMKTFAVLVVLAAIFLGTSFIIGDILLSGVIEVIGLTGNILIGLIKICCGAATILLVDEFYQGAIKPLLSYLSKNIKIEKGVKS